MPSYDSAYYANFLNQSVNSSIDPVTFTTLSGNKVTIPLQKKAIQDTMPNAYDLDYGRMLAWLGSTCPGPPSGCRTTRCTPTPPPVEIINDSRIIGEPMAVASDGTQIWKITHYGMDTHPIHFHLFNVQLINRFDMNGTIFPTPTS